MQEHIKETRPITVLDFSLNLGVLPANVGEVVQERGKGKFDPIDDTQAEVDTIQQSRGHLRSRIDDDHLVLVEYARTLQLRSQALVQSCDGTYQIKALGVAKDFQKYIFVALTVLEERSSDTFVGRLACREETRRRCNMVVGLEGDVA